MKTQNKNKTVPLAIGVLTHIGAMPLFAGSIVQGFLNRNNSSFNTPEVDRTRNTQIDNLVLSPIELPGHRIWKGFKYSLSFLVLLVFFNPLCIALPLINLNAISQIESSGNKNAVGDSGQALGLFQLHQAVVVDYNRAHNTSYLHTIALDATISRQIASWYLNIRIPALLKHFHKTDTLENRLTAYNRGIGVVIHGKTAANYIAKYKKLESLNKTGNTLEATQ